MTRQQNIFNDSPGFTLIELLIVIGIVVVLGTVVAVVLDPVELLRQARDSNRIADMSAIVRALNLAKLELPDSAFGTPNTIYLSLPDTSATCGNLLPTLPPLPPSPPTWQYTCVTSADLRDTDSSGWLPVNFSGLANGTPLASLPVDPLNFAATGRYFTYVVNTNGYVITAALESEKRLTETAKRDGGADDARLEMGSNITLWASAMPPASPPPDTTPPAQIANLVADNPTQTSIRLTWTAPGNDGTTGTAASYDMRYSTANITDANWAAAAIIPGVPAPQAAGTVQTMTVTGLTQGTMYYFAIKTSDSVPNVSALSNVPSRPTVIAGLVAWWKFDESCTTPCTAADATGAHNGTAQSTAIFISGGKFGNAISFDATPNSYISVPDNAALLLGQNITISVWVKRNSDSTQQAIYGDYSGGAEYSLELPGNSNSVLFYSGSATQLTLGTSGSGVAAAIPSWTHIAVTWNGSIAALYKDGSLVDSKSFTNNPTTSRSFPYTIGQRTSTGNKLSGSLDDLRVYNRALTLSEIGLVITGAP